MTMKWCRVCLQMDAYYPSIIMRPGMVAPPKPPSCDVCEGHGAVRDQTQTLDQLVKGLNTLLFR
jgi:hypothetical protein